MSRHEVPTIDPERYQCVVGFDPPLDTFFAQVIDRQVNARLERRSQEREALNSDPALLAGQEPAIEQDLDEEEDYFVLWLGTSLGEIESAAELARKLESFVELAPEMQKTLEEDCQREARPPTKHQQMMRQLLFKPDDDSE